MVERTINAQERLLYLDVVKIVMVFSFIISHVASFSMHYSIYWNTGCFILFSGYLSGKTINRKHVRFSHGLQRCMRLLLSGVLYLFIMIAIDVAGHSTKPIYSGLREASLYISIFVYIGLFYLVLPCLSSCKNKTSMALTVFAVITTAGYMSVFLPHRSLPEIVRLFFYGNSYSLHHYPILSFLSLGFLGFAYAHFESKFRWLSFSAFPIIILCYAIILLVRRHIFVVEIERAPMLLFYSIFSLAVFAGLIVGSRVVTPLISTHKRMVVFITNSSRYTLWFFLLHQPLAMAAKHFFSFENHSRGMAIDAPVAVLSAFLLFMILYFLIDHTIARIPYPVKRFIL